MSNAGRLLGNTAHAACIFSCLLLCSTPAIAIPPEPPLAKASDVEFTVEYSNNTLMLGDALLAQVSIENKSDRAVRIADFHRLVIRAKTPSATQLAFGFGEYPGGTSLQKLAPGERIVFEVDLDVFSDDRHGDGTFDPFDGGLTGEKVVFHATASTLMPHTTKDHNLDYQDCLLQHSQVIEFGQPLIGRTEFDSAVKKIRKRDGLKSPMGIGLGNQRSYLVSQSDDPSRNWALDDRTGDAIFHVHLERLPAESALRRAATIQLEVSKFLSAESIPAEEQAISKLLSVLGECTHVERAYWKSRIRDLSKSEDLRLRIRASQHKVDLLSNRITKDEAI